MVEKFKEFFDSGWLSMTDTPEPLKSESQIKAKATDIPGLQILEIPVHKDNRGWFKENWHLSNFRALGLGQFKPVQQNVSFNLIRGVTRGLHAEPWDKLVSVASGAAFGVWLDLRAGDSFGKLVQATIEPGTLVYIPRGVANGFQALEDGTAYSYLVNDHWSAETSYVCVNLRDPSLGVRWPIEIDHSMVSEKDLAHPGFSSIAPIQIGKPLVIGSSGQLAKALRAEYPDGVFLSSKQFDMRSSRVEEALLKLGIDAGSLSCVINAAAFTNVDQAETRLGGDEAWATNVLGVKELVGFCRARNLRLVHVSSDFIFNGNKPAPYSESDLPNPINFYGFTKASADLLVEQLENHLIIRPSWVIGESENFVSIMSQIALAGKKAKVVGDQIGRFTFANELAKAIRHLIENNCPSGTYNVTGAGEAMSRADWARRIFSHYGRNPSDVESVTSLEYSGEKTSAQRPNNSTLSLEKLTNTGFTPRSSEDSLYDHLSALRGYPSPGSNNK
jgi:dTDP-4-dehydrorhamnose reductase/dTDP-4-dehydrorhamnose 3,5-epimerase